MIYYGFMHLIDFLGYYLTFRRLFHAQFVKSIAWKAVALAGSLAVTELIIFAKITSFDEMAVALTCMIAIVALVREERIRALFLFPVSFLLSGSANILFSYVISLVIRMPYPEFYSSDVMKILSEIPWLVTLLIFAVVRPPKDEERILHLSVPKYLLVFLGVGSFFALVGITQGFMLEKAEAATLIRLMAVCIVTSVILFVILILWQGMIEKKASEYRMENELYRQYLEKQEAHIHDIVASDQKLRSFRHDLRAHVTALETGIREGDLDFLKTYVARIKEENEKYSVKQYTGIAPVDAVIEEWHQKALKVGAEWNWDGGLLKREGIETFDLCVIFSNLLSNAVEALEYVEDGRKRQVSVYYGAYQDSIILRVTNTCQLSENRKDFKTIKADKQNHGYGLKSIEEIVKKANGSYANAAENGEFRAEIII